MQSIPLVATPSQRLTVTLGQQNCGLALYQKRSGLFLDLYVSGSLLVSAALCRDRVYLIREAYPGFAGDLAFTDSQGTDDPHHTGLGARWLLYYVELTA